MKIAIVNHNLGSGGAEKLIYDMALRLKEKKIEFAIILLTSIGDVYGKELIKHGIKVHYLSNKWDIYNPKNIYKLKKVLKDYNIVHTHTYPAQIWGMFSKFFLPRVKFITTEHNTINNRRKYSIFKLIDKFMYSKYDKIVSITEEVQKNLRLWTGLDDDNIVIIKNGIKLEKYRKALPIKKDELSIDSEDILLIMIARFNKQKDHITLIRAMNELPKNYKLILVGEGELKEACMNYVNQLNLNSKIKFLGYRSDVPNLLKTSDLSILSSNYEGLPISIIETIASGTFFLGSRVPGIEDLITYDECLYEHKNAQDLSNKILSISKNTKLKMKFEKLLVKKSEEFSIKKCVDEYIKLYLETINE